jgi:hypothetical protein
MSEDPEVHAVVPRQPADVVQFRRDDLAALAASSRIRARPSSWQGAAVPASGLATFAALIGLQELGGIAALSTPLCIGAGVAVCAVAAGKAWRAERARRAAYAFSCPACGLEIVSATPGADDGTRAELVVASGCCPGCGARIVAD